MARPTLPPRGYFIPTHMIFRSQMPPAVFLTWLQLRCLTWCGPDLPHFSFAEWVDLTGTSRASLTRHLNWLQHHRILRWSSPQPGVVGVHFNPRSQANLPQLEVSQGKHQTNLEPCPEVDNSPHADPKMGSSIQGFSKMKNPPSLKPHPSGFKIQVVEPGYTESAHILRDELEQQGEGESEGGRGGAGAPLPSASPGPRAGGSQSAPTQALHSDPVAVYRALVHLTPNPAQRRILLAQVHDLTLWQQSLEHWLGHGWNPRNLTGMLELYQRNGPQGCRYCRKAPPAAQPSETPLQHSLAALEALCLEQERSPSGGSQASR